MHKTKQKRDRNRTTTSLVLDSSMQRGRWEFRLNQRIWLPLSSVFESRRISFFKIFLVFSMQRRLWRVCTFAQAQLSLRHSTEKSCADSNRDLCAVYKNSECCCEAVPATMAHLSNHQCVVSMRQKCSQCVVIKLFNKNIC